MNLKELQDKLNKALENKDLSYVLKGSAFTALAMVVVQVLRFGGGVIIGRAYGPEIHGELRLLTVFVSSITILASFGLKDAMLRLIPEYRTKGDLRTAWDIYKKGTFYLFLFSIAGTIAVLLVAPWYSVKFAVPHLKPIFLLSAIFIFPLMFNGYNDFTLRALFKIKEANILRIIIIGLRLVALIVITLFFYHSKAPLYIYLFIMCGAAGLISVIYIYKCFYKSTFHTISLSRDRIDVNKESFCKPKHVTVRGRDLLLLSFPMLLTYANFLINDKADSLMIQHFTKSSAQLGIYGACLNMANIGRMVMQAMNTTIQPKLSELYHSGRIPEMKYIAQKASKTITLLNIPVTLLLTFGAYYLLWIYGESYTTGKWALIILVIGQMVNTAAGPTAQLLNVSGHHVQFMLIAFLGAVLNIIINVILIPQYGIEGAAVASAISMVAWNVIATIYIYRKFGFYVGYIPFLSEKFLNK